MREVSSSKWRYPLIIMKYKMGLTDVYRTFNPIVAEYTFLSVHGTFSKIDHMLEHQTGLKNFKKKKNLNHSMRLLWQQSNEAGNQQIKNQIICKHGDWTTCSSVTSGLQKKSKISGNKLRWPSITSKLLRYSKSSVRRGVYHNWCVHEEIGKAPNKLAINAAQGPRKATNQTQN